jgi:hypothetical protein
MRSYFTQSLELDTNQKYLQRLQRTFCSFHTDFRASRNLHLVGSTDGIVGGVSLRVPGRGSAAGPEKKSFKDFMGGVSDSNSPRLFFSHQKD